MLTILLLIVPFISAFLLFFFGSKQVRTMTIIFSLLEFALALYTLQFVNTEKESMLTYRADWIPSLGISFHVGIDGISMLMILIATALVPLIVYASFNKIYNNYHTLYSLMLLMQSAII